MSMLKDITLGQFFPGESPLHKMDPRSKIILTVMYIVAVFMVKNIFGFALICAFTVALIAMSKISFKTVLKGLKPLLFIIAFTAIINVFWTRGDTLLVEFYFIKIYYEGVMLAIFMIIRIASLLAGTSVILTYTTSPIALTGGIEKLLAPLSKIKVPVHEFSMIMTIALRFIPTLVEETDKIMSAQKARGADFSSGNIIQKAKSLIPILIPLFISAFRRADDLATAMECRCYRGGEGRTSMKVFKMKAVDYGGFFCLALLIAAVVLINIYAPGYSI